MINVHYFNFEYFSFFTQAYLLTWQPLGVHTGHSKMLCSFVSRSDDWHWTSDSVLRWCGGRRRQGGRIVDWWNSSSRVVQWR